MLPTDDLLPHKTNNIPYHTQVTRHISRTSVEIGHVGDEEKIGASTSPCLAHPPPKYSPYFFSPPFRFVLLLSLFSLPVSLPPLLIALTQRRNMLLTVTAAAFSLAAPTISDRCSRVRTADPFQLQPSTRHPSYREVAQVALAASPSALA